MRLILASQSLSRRALLEGAGLDFEAMPSAVDEAAIKESAQAEGVSAADTAILLADAKAARIARRHPEAVVIGADQLLVCEGEWFDKPPDLAAARGHLLKLRNRAHELMTAVVVWRNGQRAWHHLATPRLAMRDFSDAFLDEYLAREGGFVTQSVGAYRLEGMGIQLMRDIRGEHTAILGLPLLPLLAYLRDAGVIKA
ncbi:Maf family protein [Sediminicoccus rosea]|uniref:Nucleoside triphosphate pyrophosphatase n=1 Tax=Sediminicoccus rosea TaxID=1225128 RepID=A0ABZ0PJH5_9PROT|nr:nucleoside triphosphate pyrophosphatase [Sediminicoccus rosea]WPB85478.1 nucleoside triphosphate pyrophosphatase [Sediminicoccus rosea]